MQKRNIKNVRLITTAAVLLLLGFIAGALSYPKLFAQKPRRAISVLISDGKTTRTWNGVEATEGQSIADTLDKINALDPIGITWDGTGKDRSLGALLSHARGEGGSWVWYLDGATSNSKIGRFFPKGGEVVTILWNAQ